MGYSAAKTLKLAQDLYETHKVLTYPRTDARVLPDDYVPVAVKAMDMLATHYAPLQAFARKVLDSNWIKPDKRIFNSAKVSDHFAIIPTGKEPENLPTEEAALYKMVVQRFVAVFYPAAEYLDTERITKIENDHFKSRRRVVLNAGWTVVYGAESQDEEEKDDKSALPAVAAGERPPATQVVVVPEETKPPLHYTEATLLTAMETAGRAISEEDLREAMSERGLGTPATRASIIEALLNYEYLERKKKELWATEKGVALISRLKSLTLDGLCSPQLTGEWGIQVAPDGAGTGAAKRVHARHHGERCHDGGEGEECGPESSSGGRIPLSKMQEDPGLPRQQQFFVPGQTRFFPTGWWPSAC